MISLPIALLDANSLYSQTLRDVLMTLALAGIFEARWTDEIQDEWMRNVLKNRPDLLPERLANTRALMEQNLSNALVSGYEPLIEVVTLPDANDRHVLAAAIHCGAPTIVTFNLSDFPKFALQPHGIIAQHPDVFLSALFALYPRKSWKP